MRESPEFTINQLAEFAPPKFSLLCRVLQVKKEQRGKWLLFLKDATGFLTAHISVSKALPREGDWIRAELFHLPSGFRISNWHLIQKGSIPKGASNWEKMARGDWEPATFYLLIRIIQLIREFFLERKYQEIFTPALIPYPSFDPNVESLPVWVRYGKKKRKVYLHTSPEYLMKMYLVSGERKIFQICPVFRDGEWTPMHQPEFWMCEWYQVGTDYLGIMEEVEDLLIFLTRKLFGDAGLKRAGFVVKVEKPFERITVHDAFLKYAGKDISSTETSLQWQEGFPAEKYPGSEQYTWEEWFFRIMGEMVEPRLGWDKPTFLMDFPARLGTMAKQKEGSPDIYERFELFIAGLELGNGYTELTDWREQKRRFQQKKGKKMPREFLSALKTGISPCAGFSLGIERVALLFTQQSSLSSLLPFPLEQVMKRS